MVSVARTLTYAAMALAIVMLLGSCDYKTRRYFESTPKQSEAFDADEYDQWAALTSFCSLIAIAAVGNVMATIAPRHGGSPGLSARAVVLTLGALALFALGANVAWRHWMAVIAEQQRVSYEVQIAYGLPVVTYGGTLGTVTCLTLIVVLLIALR
jgi:hypothetical protein